MLQFLLLGAAIFVLFQFTGNSGEPQDGKIVVTPGKVEQLVMGFSRTWQRPPTSEELNGLVEDYIKEEVFYREALAMRLDKDDTIVRRRLRQKIEFLTEDAAAAPPTEQDLQAWLEKHPDKFRLEPKAALRQVFVNVHRRGQGASKEAAKLLARLNSAASKVDASTLGDASLLPHELPLSSVDDIARVFGDSFVQQLPRLEPGRWAGPVQSGYGLHLVYVSERTEGRFRPLAEVREAVKREWLSARREEVMEATYRKMRAKYAVVVQPPEARLGGSPQPGNAANAAEKRQ